MNLLEQFRKLNWRGRILISAILLLTICLLKPQANLPKKVFDWFIVFDITQSMNVRDMSIHGKELSRLAFAKDAIRTSLKTLPCGSRVAIGLFTERDTSTVTYPMEVCAHFGALDATIANIDWRMAWAADSYIVNGLFSAIKQTQKLDNNMRIAFISDGNQAPPINPDYIPQFEGKVGAVSGSIFGIGGENPAHIPKLDTDNNISGYWELEEVMRYATFGVTRKTQSVLEMENHHGRNAPHGSNPAESTNAHLSALDESNLKALAKDTGVNYFRLTNTNSVVEQLTNSKMATWRTSKTDLRAWFATPALLLVILFFIPESFLHRCYSQFIQLNVIRKAL